MQVPQLRQSLKIATNDPKLIWGAANFSNLRSYLKVGTSQLTHPSADLLTGPRLSLCTVTELSIKVVLMNRYHSKIQNCTSGGQLIPDLTSSGCKIRLKLIRRRKCFSLGLQLEGLPLLPGAIICARCWISLLTSTPLQILAYSLTSLSQARRYMPLTSWVETCGRFRILTRSILLKGATRSIRGRSGDASSSKTAWTSSRARSCLSTQSMIPLALKIP